MMPLSDFPPDLNTPFNDMVGFLLRETQGGEPEDYDYIRAVSKTFMSFTDLPHKDMIDLIALCIRYGYFDQPATNTASLDDYFAAMDIERLEQLDTAVKRLLAEEGGDSDE